MNVHYDSNAVCKNRKTTMVSSAKKILAEEEGGVDQRYFKGRFVADRYHSMAFFKKVCRNIGNLRNKEIEQMLTVLKNTEQGKAHIENEIYQFRGEDMYEVLCSDPICKKVCEKQRYTCWEDIISRFC